MPNLSYTKVGDGRVDFALYAGDERAGIVTDRVVIQVCRPTNLSPVRVLRDGARIQATWLSGGPVNSEPGHYVGGPTPRTRHDVAEIALLVRRCRPSFPRV